MKPYLRPAAMFRLSAGHFSPVPTIALLLAAAFFLSGCFGGRSASPVPPRTGQTIAFDVRALDAEGRYAPKGEEPRHLPYEFCVPARDDILADVRRTDATALCAEVASGTAGCGPDEMLCVGNTRQTDFRGVLLRLAEKPYIREIRAAISP
jgi:hypothetical protein